MADTPTVLLMPVVNGWPHTALAIADCLAQALDPKPLVLVCNQGATDDIRAKLEVWADQEARLLVWTHDPPLPSLSATWNTLLDWAWAIGAEEAMVVNNDIRIRDGMYTVLRMVATEAGAFLVSGVGVREEQYEASDDPWVPVAPRHRGGPDFSCFLITRAGHEAYRFDEQFIPAFAEDLDLHRRMMLGGDGERIFGLNLPFAHLASATLKTMDDEARAKFARRLDGSRAYYAKKWGGPVNAERFSVPFDPESAQDGVTTPELQRACLSGSQGPDSPRLESATGRPDPGLLP